MMRYYLIAFLIFCADQISKKIILFSLSYQEQLHIFSWLDIVHIRNRGVAFSMFADAAWANYFFLTFGIIVIIFLAVWLRQKRQEQSWMERLGLALILGGASGNIADRIQYGAVIDFIAVHYKHWYYPSFNIADSAITIGALIIVLLVIRGNSHKQKGA